jgi:phosphonate transport system ATP-binding protein
VPVGEPAPLAALTPGAHLVVRALDLEREGRRLVSSLSFSAPRGAFLAVTGPSGVGKSSLLACLAGRLPPTTGEVGYVGAGGVLRPARELVGRLGLVFQDHRLVPTASLLDNVLCGRLARRPWWATLAGLPRAGRAEARALLAALRIDALARRPAAEASGGEQQRASLARALFLEPEVVLADEPVSALDPEMAEHALHVLRREARRLSATVVCVLHDPPLVRRFADLHLELDPRLPGGFRFGGVDAPGVLERRA